MKFEEIFDKAGWYVAKSFDEGVVIFIEHGVHDTEMKVMCFDNPQAIAPLELKIPVYRGLFKKDFIKVFNRGSLFGDKRKQLFNQ